MTRHPSKRRFTAAVLVTAALWNAGAMAPEAAGAATEAVAGRYTMKETDDGFIRLDTQTGAMSLCKKQNDDFACQLIPESQDRIQSKLEDLARENKQLRAEIERLEKHFGIGPDSDPGSAPGQERNGPGPQAGQGRLQIPSEKDVDQLFDYVEGMLKKFRERIERLEKHSEGREETPL